MRASSSPGPRRGTRSVMVRASSSATTKPVPPLAGAPSGSLGGSPGGMFCQPSEPTASAQPQASVYLGGRAGGQEADVGLSMDRVDDLAGRAAFTDLASGAGGRDPAHQFVFDSGDAVALHPLLARGSGPTHASGARPLRKRRDHAAPRPADLARGRVPMASRSAPAACSGPGARVHSRPPPSSRAVWWCLPAVRAAASAA